MAFNEVIVLGAGAIGSVYGALLSRKVKVRLIGRKKHVQAIQKNGLNFSGKEDKTFRLEACTSAKKIPSKALILLTTKAQDSAKAVKSIKPLLRADSTLLVLQNGFGQEREIKKLAGKAKVLQGLTYCGATFIAPGKIYLGKKGKTILERSSQSREIAGLFRSAGLETEIAADFRQKKWEKLLVNCIINPLTAIFNIKNQHLSARQLNPLKKELLNECLAVAKAEKIMLGRNFLAKINQVAKISDNKSSMLQDLEAGRKTEIDFLNGKIAELGRKHGISTPLNQAATELVKARYG